MSDQETKPQVAEEDLSQLTKAQLMERLLAEQAEKQQLKEVNVRLRAKQDTCYEPVGLRPVGDILVDPLTGIKLTTKTRETPQYRFRVEAHPQGFNASLKLDNFGFQEEGRPRIPRPEPQELDAIDESEAIRRFCLAHHINKFTGKLCDRHEHGAEPMDPANYRFHITCLDAQRAKILPRKRIARGKDPINLADNSTKTPEQLKHLAQAAGL